MDLSADIRKAREALGWSPSIDFESGLERLVRGQEKGESPLCAD
jgi:nucleoside-diphosphate-sugar epimerase